MISLKSKREIEILRFASKIISHALAELEKAVKPGVTTHELDQIAEDVIKKSHAIPAFKGYRGFPATICASVNSEVVLSRRSVARRFARLLQFHCRQREPVRVRARSSTFFLRFQQLAFNKACNFSSCFVSGYLFSWDTSFVLCRLAGTLRLTAQSAS